MEVAHLLKQSAVAAAAELLHAVRTAGGSVQAGPACFRMLLQRLACSPPETAILNRVTQEMSLHSFPPDALTQACCVRCLCRGPSADIEKAHHAYTAMLANGITPDLHTVECLAEASLRMHRNDLVKPLILALDDYGMEPSPTLYAALIAACAATGSVACGMVAFDQMRSHFPTDLSSIQLGYSSVIHMCAQSRQVDRALVLLDESRKLSRERGLSPADLEAKLLAPLLAAAVQTGRAELALDLAHRAHKVSAATAGTSEGQKFLVNFNGLCKLLLKRQGSQMLMEQVMAILHAPSVGLSDTQQHLPDGDVSVAAAKDQESCPATTTSPSASSLFRVMRSALQLLLLAD